jgi:hypothetical protein
MVIRFDEADAWLQVPLGQDPEPPPVDADIDTPGSTLNGGRIAWAPVLYPHNPDLYIVRINYVTSAPPNLLLAGYSIGGPHAHPLWELYIPRDYGCEITLPSLPDEAPRQSNGSFILENPLPNPDDPQAPQHYGKDDLEVEFNAYIFGATDKEFDYNRDFLFSDINMEASGVSQDSYIFKVPAELTEALSKEIGKP